MTHACDDSLTDSVDDAENRFPADVAARFKLDDDDEETPGRSSTSSSSSSSTATTTTTTPGEARQPPGVTQPLFAQQPSPRAHQGDIRGHARAQEPHANVQRYEACRGSAPNGIVARGDIKSDIVDPIFQALKLMGIRLVAEDPSSGSEKELGGHDFEQIVQQVFLGGAKAPDPPTTAPCLDEAGQGANPAMVAGDFTPEAWEGSAGEVVPRATDYMMGNGGGTASGPLGSVPFSRPH
jgi:hypothetical protein